MRKKCDHCNGKGGHTVKPAKLARGVYVSCQNCQGKGVWWPKQHLKNRKRPRQGG